MFNYKTQRQVYVQCLQHVLQQSNWLATFNGISNGAIIFQFTSQISKLSIYELYNINKIKRKKEYVSYQHIEYVISIIEKKIFFNFKNTIKKICDLLF